MKGPLHSYLSNISEKVALVVCNDCVCLQNLTSASNLVSFTFLGSIINDASLESFWQSIQAEDVKEIIIAGHYQCEIMDFLPNQKTSDPNWDEAKGYMKKLAEYYYPLIGNKPDKEKRLLRYHISKQVKRIAEFGLKNKTIKKRLTIKGIIINDENNKNEVEEIDLSVILEQLPFHLN
jgi:carbonic anhydrase